ncbi:MAG: Na+/H+ antiporter [Microbacteriaceae bacterium]|nr:Na+/H+ antiporter [Microbacteriaceae bacterium]
MDGLILVVALGAAIIVGGTIASRLRIPPPLVLLILGAGLGFVPFFGHVTLPPELVLLLFLPGLLYWESINTSLREIRNNLRVILLLAVGLVFATTAVIAVIGHAFGLTWPVAIALGAILAPTDATAVAAVVGHLPRRAGTILRAESLVNDGTALVLYASAVTAAVSGKPVVLGETVLRFLASYGVGILIGALAGFIVVGIRKFLKERLLANTLSVLTPFLAYLPAESLGVSGVVAVVTCGLVLSQRGPQLITASMRSQSFGFWQLTTFILNGSLFVLIGLELHRVIQSIGDNWSHALALGVAATVAVIVTRLAWSNGTTYLIRAIDRRPKQRARRSGFRQRFPIAWAGFRGAVSLAAALALPTNTASGAPLPGRSVVIAVTFVVILLTLIVLGLTLPAIVRWSRLSVDPAELDEELLAEQVVLNAALEALPGVASSLSAPDEAREAVRRDYEERLGRIHREEGDPSLAHVDETETDLEAALRLGLLPAKRSALVQLRDARRIDDIVHRRVLGRIDLEELRLSDAPGDD